MVGLPASFTLTLFWNFGRMLGLVLVFQVFTGLFLSFFYSNERIFSFFSVQYIMYEVSSGWIFRLFHFNGASLFFFFLYLHFFKGMFFFSFRLWKVWARGLTLFLLVMGEAFMGYVLVWAQMSYWASVVIISLLSVIPFFGVNLVYWFWGGFFVGASTLKFFFSLHFLLPWSFFVLLLLHLFFLHETGRSSSLLLHSQEDKLFFFPFFFFRDFYNFFFFFGFFFFVFYFPFTLGDAEMFTEANPLVSPSHIVPEWYFLFAYAILRSIPSKPLGVFFLLLSIFFFFLFCFTSNFLFCLDLSNFVFVFSFLSNSLLLRWLGHCSLDSPFVFLGGLSSFFYFLFFFFIFFNFLLPKFLF